MSRYATVAKALDYMLTSWEWFARFLTDGRICLTTMPLKGKRSFLGTLMPGLAPGLVRRPGF
ncbi:hypothetical protein C0V82_26445 (plasmid) [Niveispirillum cyanobacteriorum]|uniref:Uncharacterized protein n=1 Tax=Niveispirillum cyanobacteriorum TaxID=1612173 RepID=A0A2K9NLK3_9PROT|nr:hypothetical protein C0V82_26445 [Niveispirillum cyanobacteriorum]